MFTVRCLKLPLLASFLFFTVFCGDKGVTPGPDATTPKPVVIYDDVVPAGGGTITIKGNESGLSGMTVTIPPIAASSATKLTVSTLAATPSDTSKGFIPASPVITVSGPGRVDSSLYEITVPIKAAPGQFAMAFICDNKGTMREALPLVDKTDTSITIAVASLGGSKGLARSASGMVTEALTFTVRTIAEQKLASLPDISSGFRPGVDDWEFVNYGSYIAPNGHCAGQSLSAMWYYYEKRQNGARPLFHAFDLVNMSRDRLWQDNPQGFRAASMVQKDIQWDGIVANLFRSVTKTKEYDKLTFQAFSAAILATGQPQYVSIKSNKGGHAIIAYRVSPSQRRIYIADPNFPGEERFLAMENDTFLPYASKQNAADIDSNSYTRFGFIAKSALVDWAQIGKRMAEMEAGTVGNGVFPAYSLRVAEGSGYPLTDGFTTDKDTLLFEAISKACEMSYDVEGRQYIEVYDTTGTLLAESQGKNAGPVKGQVFLVLKPGKNRFGVTVWGWRSVTANTMRRHYVDFKWLTVNYLALAVEPEQVRAKVNETIRFAVKPGAQGPSNRKFEWDFGDGKGKITLPDTTVSYSYSKSGVFPITVVMKERTTGEPVAQGKATAIVTGGPPTIDTIIPSAARTFDTITIRGRNFGSRGDSSIVTWSFDDTADTYLEWNDSTIVMIVPENAQSGWLNVRIGSEVSSGKIFTLLYHKPIITAVLPERIYAGDTVTIKGKFFRQKRGTYYLYTTVMFPVGTGSAISGTQWGDSLFVWTDTLVKVRATAPVISGGLRVTCENDTSLPFPIKVGYRMAEIRSASISVTVDADLRNGDSSMTTVKYMSFPISQQKFQSAPVSTSVFNFLYDTLYETGTSIVTRVHKRREFSFKVDFDRGVMETFSGVALDENTNVQSGNSTGVKTVITGGPLPLTLANNGGRYIDSLTSVLFKVLGDSICNRVTTLTYEAYSQKLVSYRCTSSSMISAYIEYVRGKRE